MLLMAQMSNETKTEIIHDAELVWTRNPQFQLNFEKWKPFDQKQLSKSLSGDLQPRNSENFNCTQRRPTIVNKLKNGVDVKTRK